LRITTAGFFTNGIPFLVALVSKHKMQLIRIYQMPLVS